MNTATIRETGQSDMVAVNLSCYAPLVTTDANTAYTRTHSWGIEKSVSPASHAGFAGDSYLSDYVVSVNKNVFDGDFIVSGTIMIANPNPTGPMTVFVSDNISAAAVTLDCTNPVIVPAYGVTAVGYSADFGDIRPSDGTNVVRVSLPNGTDFEASSPYVFLEPTEMIGFTTVNVDDSNGQTWTASGDAVWTYCKTFSAPTDPTVYTSGIYSAAIENTATIRETGQKDSTAVELTSYLPASARVVLNTQEGSADIGQFPFKYELHDPSGIVVETLDLNGAGAISFLTPIKTTGNTYNGLYPGPLIKVAQGDVLKIHFRNALPATTERNILGFEENHTNLHTHGFHVSPKEPSDAAHLDIGPGETYDYI